jgi:hypothetical protein
MIAPPSVPAVQLDIEDESTDITSYAAIAPPQPGPDEQLVIIDEEVTDTVPPEKIAPPASPVSAEGSVREQSDIVDDTIVMGPLDWIAPPENTAEQLDIVEDVTVKRPV